MKNTKQRLVELSLAMVLVCSLLCTAGCYGGIEYNDYLSVDGYDKSIFYQNDGVVSGAADPCVITVGDTYYLYATNAMHDGNTGYLQGWKSTNLSDWTELGAIFVPQRDSWGVTSLWAPEVVEKDGIFYMYYSAKDSQTGVMGIGVATSSSPEGPFSEIEGTIDGKAYSHKTMPIDFGFPSIDPNLFVDDNGDIYLYVSKDQVSKTSSIFVAKMKNMVEIEYIGENALVTPSQTWENPTSSNKWNEAPHVIKHNGKYYLFYSANYYQNSSYAVGVAVSDNPMYGFEKVADNPILEAHPDWSFVSGTGHNSIFPSADGTELFIAYHSHIDVKSGGSERKICFDRIAFDNDGIPVVSGPSVTPQLLPSGSGAYKNIASLATVTSSNGSDTSLLADGIVNYKSQTSSKYECSLSAKTTFTFTFDKEYDIVAVMIYDSCLYSASATVANVQIDSAKIKLNFNMTYCYVDEYEFEHKQPGSCAIAQFAEVAAKQIKITLDKGVALSEIVIVGK